MRTILLACAFTVMLTGWARADWTLQTYDCTSVDEYWESNRDNFVELITGIIPFLPGSWLQADMHDSLMPSARGDSSLSWVGVAINLLSVFVQIGGSPAGGVNLLLNPFCLELADMASPESTPRSPL